MAARAQGPAGVLLAALLASALVSPTRGRGGRDHGNWDPAAQLLLPPVQADPAHVARSVANLCDWGSLATISTLEEVRGRPFADVLSVSDGLPGRGTGVPYFYLSPLMLTAQNLQEDPYATLVLSMAETIYCIKKQYDPQSPLCVHIILSGTVTEVTGSEKEFAEKSLFTRHPSMESWPTSHDWYFAKLNITNIWVQDYFGGPKIVTPEEYFNVTIQ